MKWTLRYAVLLAALTVALGTVGATRPDVAIANDDVVVHGPTNDRGDPDVPDGVAHRFWLGYWFRTKVDAVRTIASSSRAWLQVRTIDLRRRLSPAVGASGRPQ